LKLFYKQKQKQTDKFVFKKHIFKKSNKSQVVFILNFSEFGVETLSCLYSIPMITDVYKSFKTIVVGWSGREYLYRHLVDEFWELDESFYYLKDYSNAFYNTSKDIKNLEKKLGSFGVVVTSGFLGNFFVANVCKNCLNYWTEKKESCDRCGFKNFSLPILETLDKKNAVGIPVPFDTGIEIPNNSVAIFARNRKTYGRNLPKDFYLNLNNNLKQKGYNPIYLGENSTSLNMSDCVDFSSSPNSKKLEFTLETLSKVKFTIQFWTASTRLAAITKTPYILVESPNQVGYHAQELKRIALTTDFNKKKIIVCHYLDFLKNQDIGISLINDAINEIENNNWNHIIGMVKNKEILHSIIKENKLDSW
jgi:hypothetical protein